MKSAHKKFGCNRLSEKKVIVKISCPTLGSFRYHLGLSSLTFGICRNQRSCEEFHFFSLRQFLSDVLPSEPPFYGRR